MRLSKSMHTILRKLYSRSFLSEVTHKWRGDGVHALIERTMRNKEIYLQACYIPLMKMAKNKDHTYNVNAKIPHFFSQISLSLTLNRQLDQETTCYVKLVDISQ